MNSSVFRSTLTPDDCRNFYWQSIIADADEQQCRVYSRLFFEQAKKFEAEGNQTAREICVLMGIITSFGLSLDTPNEPYKPEWSFPSGARSAIPSGITQEHWNILLSIVGDIQDPEMRARVADVLWVVRQGNYQTAQSAIDAYLEAAKVLEDPESWTEGAHRIERALQLATQLGREGEYFDKAIGHIEDVLDRLNGEDPLWFSHKLMALLLDVRVGDPNKYAALAEKIARRAEATRSWRRARDYWEIEARWLERAQLLEDQHKVKLLAAETYVHEANDLISAESPNYAVAADELRDAVEALRRMGASKEMIKRVHALLLDCQEKSAAQMDQFSFSVDISDLVNEAQNAVKGKTLRDAILFLAGVYRPPSVDELRKEVLEHKNQFPLTWFIQAQQVNEKGRVTAIRPGISFGDDQDTDEIVLRAEMYRQATFHQGVQAEATILPMLNQINLEHHIRLGDLIEFVVNNPFVPPGHEMLYARGLYSGLTGDFLVAAHILLPQIENSIRYLLEQQNVIATNLDSQRIQDVYDLGKLLYMPETEQIFGADLLFDLQGLLVNRFGSNLRNDAAHGMLKAPAFGSRQIIYFWRVTLYLCCHPALLQASRNSSETAENTGEQS